MQNKAAKEWLDRLKRRDDNTLVINCDCTDQRHEIHFEIEPTDGSYGGPIGTFQLNLIRQPSFFKRVVIAVNYLFGRHPLMWGGWYEIDGAILNEYELKKLRDFITEKLK